VPSTILIVGTRPSVTSVRWTTNGNTLPERQHNGTVYGIGSAPVHQVKELGGEDESVEYAHRRSWLLAGKNASSTASSRPSNSASAMQLKHSNTSSPSMELQKVTRERYPEFPRTFLLRISYTGVVARA
jgi:hypothetical protein